MRAPVIDSVCAALDAAITSGEIPAAQCCVLVDGEIGHLSAHGCTPASVFDLASVTKVAATTSALSVLLESGEIDLDDPLQRFVPRAHFNPTLRALLGHRSGLPAWEPLFTRVMRDQAARACFASDGSSAPATAWARAREIILAAVLEPDPRPTKGTPGTRVYSDLGFITLGAVVEAVTTARLDRWCAEHLHRALDLGFVDLADGPGWLHGRDVLPTGTSRPREPAPGQEGLFEVPPQIPNPDPGRVDDDNAFAMGGVAGHAGLFGTALSLAQFMHRFWVEPASHAARAAFLVSDPATGSARALGFDVPTPGSTAGRLGEGAKVFGHLGFTGTSVWFDVDRRWVAVLLTNRTLRGRAQVDGIRALRPRIHNLIHDALRP